jgi:dihydropteroate synthase
MSATVAAAAAEIGADIINDISGGTADHEMLQTVAACGLPYIMMHMQGNPHTMQIDPHYDNVVKEVLHYCSVRLNACHLAGISDVIIDPGFGFGKTTAHNYELLMQMEAFSWLGCPVLAGVSRKSMINKVLGSTATEALNGTTSVHMLALEHGADILRVHDVKEAVEAIKIYKQALTAEGKN